jgi:hypothetical protein
MKRYLAAALLFLAAAWNGVLVFGCIHDASGSIQPAAVFFWPAFGFGLCVVVSLVLMALVLFGKQAAKQWLVLWITLTSVSVLAAMALIVSPMGYYALPSVYSVLPQTIAGFAIVLLVTGENVHSFGIAWPIFLALSLFVTVVFHVTIAPAEEVIIYGPDDLPGLELHLPLDNRYFLRPFSAAIAMIAWASTLLRPVIIPRSPP